MKKTICISLLMMTTVLAISFTFANRQHRVKTVQQYLKWISEEENGLVKGRYVNSTEMKVKYLPAEYLASRELEDLPSYTKNQVDSLVNYYKNSLCFSLSIGPDKRESKEKQGDIMYKDVHEYKEYAQRTYEMNFNMKEYILLKAGEKEYRPVLAAMENIYGLDTKRSILLVFVPDDKKNKTFYEAEKLELIYDDQQFELGKNYFVFERKDLKEIPDFPFNATKTGTRNQ